MHVVALSGSLNPASSNSGLLLRAAAACAGSATMQVWSDLGQLPYFSPGAAPGAHVETFRRLIAAADAVWIATPEYAGGMPGALKNALDWLVGTGELYGKPLVITSVAPSLERGHNARRWVAEVARMQGARIADSFSVAAPSRAATPEQLASSAEQALARVLGALSRLELDDEVVRA